RPGRVLTNVSKSTSENGSSLLKSQNKPALDRYNGPTNTILCTTPRQSGVDAGHRVGAYAPLWPFSTGWVVLGRLARRLSALLITVKGIRQRVFHPHRQPVRPCRRKRLFTQHGLQFPNEALIRVADRGSYAHCTDCCRTP